MQHLFAGLFLVLAMAPGGWADDGEHAVVPGARIGQVKLGIKRAEVVAILGPATGRGGDKKGMDVWSVKSKEGRTEETFVASKDDGKGKEVVEQVAVTSPFFRTSGGNSTNSDMDALWREFPGLKYERFGDQGDTSHVQLYDDVRAGIAVMIQLDAHPAAGQPWGRCRAFLVHPRGERPRFVNVGEAVLTLP